MANEIDEEWGESGDPFNPEYIAGREAAPRVKRDAVKAETVTMLEVRQRAYRMVFGADPDALEIVMADLKAFCRGERSSWDADERVHCLITGRQEVYARIQQHLNLTLDALIAELS